MALEWICFNSIITIVSYILESIQCIGPVVPHSKVIAAVSWPYYCLVQSYWVFVHRFKLSAYIYSNFNPICLEDSVVCLAIASLYTQVIAAF